MIETAVSFDCNGVPLVGILHQPTNPKPRGVLIVVGGGPQYRVGGHRQLVLWSRRMAAEGHPVFRFDYRGMGDSHGEFKGFESVDSDIKAALDYFATAVPELREFVLWGECDGSSAILFYAHRDPRVSAIVLLNPWVRTDSGQAKAILNYYYLHRLIEPSFWRKLFSFEFNPVASIRSARDLIRRARANKGAGAGDNPRNAALSNVSLPERMLSCWTAFRGPTMLVMSGRDLIAREFDQLVDSSTAWQSLLKSERILRHDLKDADHTFATAGWRDQVVNWGLEWLKRW